MQGQEEEKNAFFNLFLFLFSANLLLPFSRFSTLYNINHKI